MTLFLQRDVMAAPIVINATVGVARDGRIPALALLQEQ